MFPNFLCIGAQRAGTTWLNQALSHHPQIWTPPIKELHYFNFKSMAPSLIAHAHEPLMRYRARILLRRMAREAYKGRDIRWYLRYFFFPRNMRWYGSLFEPQRGQVAGEATPEYSILERAAVAEIHSLMPDLKIILLLRDPIERTWSQANQKYRRVLANGAHADEAVLHKFMQDVHPHQRSSYVDILQVWESVYPQEQIFIGFFEQIAEDPVALLRNIYVFLGVDHTDPELYAAVVHQKVNAGAKEELPVQWGRYLAERYYAQLQYIHQRFDNQSTTKWLANAQRYINRSLNLIFVTLHFSCYLELYAV